MNLCRYAPVLMIVMVFLLFMPALLSLSMTMADEPVSAPPTVSSGSTDESVAPEIWRQLTKIQQLETEKFETQLREFPEISETSENAVDQYSVRGDLHMYLSHFQQAEHDYRAMVRLKPELDASHWRLGIALYFANHPQDAAAQFDRYHAFDNVDRENGIWRYLSHRKAFDLEKARKQLLKYEKDDRPPFREVYRLFDGTLTPAEVLSAIPEKGSEADRESRLFYSHLYIGMNHSAEGRVDEAKASLREATLNSWPRRAGYGPNYMWHVGRLELHRLAGSESR